jgi:deoxyribodipyrimidine photo-lyase
VPVPALRIRAANDAPLRPGGEWVLYWMTAARRPAWSFALDRALEHARAFGRPLVILEALRVGYPHASDRLHRFVLDGMAANARALARAPALYHPYVEPRAGDGQGLVAALAARACAVVTDDFPAFFLPRMLAAAAPRLPVRVEAVDGNGLLPLAAARRPFPSAFAFRRFLQAELPAHLPDAPRARPFARAAPPRPAALPDEILRRWPAASPALLAGDAAALAALPVDHRVPPCDLRGGCEAARAALARFVDGALPRYAEQRNHPDAAVTSGLSPWLHFGHVSAHEVFARVADAERWAPERLAGAGGKRAGFWGMGAGAEAFLDQLVTWRELGYVEAARREDHARYDSVPGWARETLARHAGDPRDRIYSPEELEGARTSDPIWNAAQRQLLGEGTIQSYLRMLWGKRVIGWSRTPEEACAALVALNDRWALDGRDPNSYSGILWCFGKYDRPWGPERPVFGTVRYMTSASAVRKLRLTAWLARWGEGQGRLPLP